MTSKYRLPIEYIQINKHYERIGRRFYCILTKLIVKIILCSNHRGTKTYNIIFAALIVHIVEHSIINMGQIFHSTPT